MNYQIGLRFALGGLTTLGLISCRPNSAEQDTARAPHTGEACATRQFPVRAEPADSIRTEGMCELIEIALTNIGRAGPETGLTPSDTAAVKSALIVPVSQVTPDGALVRSTWHVSLSLGNRPYDAEVIVDRKNQAVTVTRMHKPL